MPGKLYLVFAASIVTFLLAPSAGGQAPVVIPAGDPSVNADTIYKLAVNPADYPTDPYVVLLDDGVVIVQADGRKRATFRYITQILTQEAADQWSERSFTYSTDREKLTLNWARVLSVDGKVISDKPVKEDEYESSASTLTPVYTRTKTQRISLSGVAAGTIVDVSYTVETFNPVLPGTFIAPWRITTGSFTRLSRFIVDAPKSMELKFKERNLPRPRKMADAGDRRVHTWIAREVKKVEPEPFMSDSNNTLYSNVVVLAPVTWERIGTWYDSLSRDRYPMTPDVKAKIAEVVAGARTLDDSVRVVHRWIAQSVRYVSISLGMGGYQPRPPSEVLETQYGDCKDKTTLFITIMRDWGISANPVLVSSGGGVDRNMPFVGAFDHVIAVMDKGGKQIYVDLTEPLTPFGEIPFEMQNSFALRVGGANDVIGVTIPRASREENIMNIQLKGTLQPDGTFNGRLTQTAAGAMQYALRANFTSALDKDDIDKMTRAMAASIFEAGTGDSLSIFDGKDLSARPEIGVSVRGAVAARGVGDSYILTIPGGSLFPPGFVEEMAEKKERKTWIASLPIFGYATVYQESRIQLPEGWTATLPKSVIAKGEFGSYESRYMQEGRDLIISRKTVGSDNVLPPTSLPNFISWLRQIAEDDPKFIVIKRNAA